MCTLYLLFLFICCNSDTKKKNINTNFFPPHHLLYIEYKIKMCTVFLSLDFLKFHFYFILQIGHEPMAPYRYRSIFGEERLILPNLIVYGN